MTDTDQRVFAETVFERNQRRDAEINEALKQENARREAAVKNMYRLRALHLARAMNRVTRACALWPKRDRKNMIWIKLLETEPSNLKRGLFHYKR
jgi:hypothetical protein